MLIILVLITCGSEGMVVVDKNSNYVHIPVFNKSRVFDVTGAGDSGVSGSWFWQVEQVVPACQAAGSGVS